MNIGGVEIHGRLALAPMAGVSDLGFRAVCKRQGAALTYTEMVSAKALTYGDKKTKTLLLISEDEHPIGAQIFGSDAATAAEGARLALELSGADFIDLNMGCPVGKVAGNGEGCALMRDVPKAAKIIEAAAKAVPVPVTVKFRKGWDSGSVNAVEFARMCQSSGAAAVCVHGRTRAQMYSGLADWDIIRDVKRAVTIPVIANGDVFEPRDAERILRCTGADMAMIGRGSFGNPWFFSRAAAAVDGRDIPPLPPLRERMDMAVVQIELTARQKGEKIACLEARRHLCWYLKGVAHAAYYKQLATGVETLEQVRRLADGVKRDLR
jgi:nifR3 family TIM-barrel protein